MIYKTFLFCARARARVQTRERAQRSRALSVARSARARARLNLRAAPSQSVCIYARSVCVDLRGGIVRSNSATQSYLRTCTTHCAPRARVHERRDARARLCVCLSVCARAQPLAQISTVNHTPRVCAKRAQTPFDRDRTIAHSSRANSHSTASVRPQQQRQLLNRFKPPNAQEW